jgi:leucyl-tRNA synthetase
MENDDFALIPIHIDFVSQYGTPNSHLNLEGISQFIKWRPEFANASFFTSDGLIEKGEIVSGNSEVKLLTKSEVGKMSKRYFNVVNPDDVVEKYGADCFRMYEMFLGPIDQSKPWDINGIDGVSKFLRKFWNLSHNEGVLQLSKEEPTKEELKVLHTAIKKVSEDIERFSMNTTISAFMMCVNELRRLNCNKSAILKPLTLLLAPFAPFIAEEIWYQLGGEGSVHHAVFPTSNPMYLVEDTILYPICVNGKKRDELEFSPDETQQNIEQTVLGLESIKKWLEGKPAKKVIIVKGRMINIVI